VLQCEYERFFRGGGTFVLLVDTVDTCDYACICQRGVAILQFYDENTNVLSKGGGNFDVLVDKCDYACICQTGWQF
jgi:hypothetical protein